MISMDRRWLRSLGVALACWSVSIPVMAEPEAKPQPNIVLIVADDVGLMDIGAYGSEIRTPHLDALAARGAKLSNFHSSPLCSPSRAMLMTGVDSHVAGLGNLPETTPIRHRGAPAYLGRLNDRVVTVATHLQRAGYRTYMTGKWHLGKTADTLPNARGFDRSFALEASGADNWEQKPYLPIYRDAPWFEDGKPATLPEDFYSSAFLVDKLIEYINAEGDAEGDGNDNTSTDATQRESTRPFFAYLAFQAAHIPVQAPRRFVEGYNGVYDAGWDALRSARHQRAVELGLMPADAPLGPMPAGLRDWNSLSTEEQHRLAKNMQVNAGMIEAMDHHIGRLVAHLQATGAYDNTLFVFLSDNGPEHNDPLHTPGMGWWLDYMGYSLEPENLGEKGTYAYIGPEFASAAASPHAFFKFYTSEGGLRVPLIFAGPGVPAQGFVGALSFMIDVAPTLLDLTGTAPLAESGIAPIAGRSLLPALRDPAERIYGDEDAIGIETAGNAALYMGPYKLVRNRLPYGDGEWRLYDLARDPGETEDLTSQMPERHARMHEAYVAWAERVGALEVPSGYNAVRQLTINWVYDGARRYGLPALLVALGLIGFWRWRRRRTTR